MAAPSTTNIIFSYVPLLTGEPGSVYLGEEAANTVTGIATYMEGLPSGAAVACLWMIDDEVASAVLVLERAEEIAKHFNVWSEGKPEDWFTFHYLESGPAYGLALMPNFTKSSERWRITFQLRYGYPPVMGSESLFFRPIHCVAPTKKAFEQAKQYLKSTVRVGLIEVGRITPENFNISPDEVHWLGSFKSVPEDGKSGLTHGWLQGVIDDMMKNPGQ